MPSDDVQSAVEDNTIRIDKLLEWAEAHGDAEMDRIEEVIDETRKNREWAQETFAESRDIAHERAEQTQSQLNGHGEAIARAETHIKHLIKGQDRLELGQQKLDDKIEGVGGKLDVLLARNGGPPTKKEEAKVNGNEKKRGKATHPLVALAALCTGLAAVIAPILVFFK